MVQHLRHAARLLIRTPGFTAAAVICLALGVAVNTTMFSLFDALVLHPFAYADPDRLLAVRATFRQSESPYLSGPELAALQSAPSVAGLAAADFGNRNLTGIETPERLFTALVISGTFETYGIAPRLGRSFSAEEHRTDLRVVIISHSLWEQRLGRDSAVIGRKIGVGGNPHTVVGVLPPRGVLGEGFMGAADLYLPLFGDPATWPRGNRQFATAVRLRDGASQRQFQTELDAIARAAERDHAAAIPEYRGWKLAALPVAKTTTPVMRTAVSVLLAAVIMVMLIACVNVANLILARAARRAREVAIRRAVGANRRHLLSQYLAEGLLLSGLSCALGVLLAVWGLDMLLALLPAQIQVLPPGSEVAINARVLGFCVVMMLGAATVFGLVPVMQGERHDLTSGLREESRGTASARARRFTDSLVAVEIALSVLLLIGTGLAIRSYAKLAAAEPGFKPGNVLIMRTTLPVHRYKPDQVTAFFKQLQERVSQLPGVESAGVANTLPVGGSMSVTFQREGIPRPEPLRSDLTVASTGYFRAIALPVRQGRLFDAVDDTADSPGVVVVNEQFAKAMFPGEQPVGKRIVVAPAKDAKWATIIGVVGNARNRGLDKPPEPEVFMPLAKDRGMWNQLWLAVKTQGEPNAMLAAIREQIRSIDPDQPVYLAMPMREVMRFATLPRRAAAWLLAMFGALAMLLAVIGLYGVIAYTVTRRTREIGVRLALGASTSDVLRLVLRNGLRLSLAGVILGSAGGAVVASFAGKLLYGISTHDLVAFTVAPAVLLAVALFASYLPALRATKVDPIIALRYD
jgi:putative ABC transport system permease protein